MDTTAPTPTPAPAGQPTTLWGKGREACDAHNDARRTNKTAAKHWEREHQLSMGADRLHAPAIEAGYDERMRELEAEGALV